MKNNHLLISKRVVQIVLGCLWVLDGLLQLQHQMFTKNFAAGVIQPAAQGQPYFIYKFMYLGIHAFLVNPILCNSIIVVIQIGLGMLILWKKTARWGLLASIPWGLFVWAFGEGFGGLFSGHALLLMGAPGAALLYAVLAIAVLPAKQDREVAKTSTSTEPARYWLALVWLAIWTIGAVYQLLPGQDSTTALTSMISANTSGAPLWLSHIDSQSAVFINGLGSTSATMSQHVGTMQMNGVTTSGNGYPFILFFAVFMLFIGFGVLKTGIIRIICLISGMLVALVFWVVGQSLGGYYTGLATDPSTGPLLILLGLTILGCTKLDSELQNLGRKISLLLTG